MIPELCEPCDVTTYGDMPNRCYLCVQCGLTAIEEPPKAPICLIKGGRETTRTRHA